MLFDIFTRDGLISFLYTLPALLISLSIHEYAHAYSAYRLGDKNQKFLGRLTLNPLSHIDIMGFVCIALFGFGWGKPVVVNDRGFKKSGRDNMLVALAGPLSNLVLAVIFTIIFKITIMLGIFSESSIFIIMLYYAISFNIIFAVFNMLPFPPFDGSKVLLYFIPSKYKHIMYTLEKYSFYIILIFFLTDLGVMIIRPIVNFIWVLLGIIISL